MVPAPGSRRERRGKALKVLHHNLAGTSRSPAFLRPSRLSKPQSVEVGRDRIRALIKMDCDIELEVLDTRTGRAFEVAASIRWREELANKIGF